MEDEHKKSDGSKAASSSKSEAEKKAHAMFDEPLGSSHNDEADLRDVARKAAQKSK